MVSLTFFIVSSICPSIPAVLVVAVLGICALLWFKGGPIARTIILVLAFLGICVLSFFWGPCLGGPDKWNILMSVATLLAVIVALFHDEIQKLVHFAKTDLYVGHDLIDVASDFDAAVDARWIRGRIKNIGDRGMEQCRLKLLKVEGQNVPPEAGKVKNGFLQWEGGIRESMRLNPGEYWIFDIGTRRPNQNSELRVFAHFVSGGPLIHCSLPAPGDYTFTLAIYGDNIQSTEQTVRIRIGEEAGDIQFPP